MIYNKAVNTRVEDIYNKENFICSIKMSKTKYNKINGYVLLFSINYS